MVVTLATIRLRRVRGIGLFVFAAAVAAVAHVGAQNAATSHPAIAPRFAVARLYDGNDPGLQVVVDAAIDAVIGSVPGLWFVDDRTGDFGVGSDATATAIADWAWDTHQAEVLLIFDATVVPQESATETGAAEVPLQPARAERGSIVAMAVQAVLVYPRDLSSPQVLATWTGGVQIDAAGRYLRQSTWEGLVEFVSPYQDAARPTVTLTVESNGPFEISGLPEWVPAASTRSTDSGDVHAVSLELRGLRAYELTVQRPGYRTRTESLYVERQDLQAQINLKRYPRHTVGPMLRGLSWPGLEYGWYRPDTGVTARLGITSFLFGLTPLRQIDQSRGEPQLISSYGLTEIEVGWHWLLRDRDRTHRPSVGLGAALRLVHGDVDFGLDPIVPVALRPTLGWEWELSRLGFLSQRMGMDVFYSPRPAFLPRQGGYVRMGPVFVQVPVYRVGLRVPL